MEAKKFDEGKPDWSILDLKMIKPMIAAMKHGEGKYGFNNWQGGVESWNRRYYSSMMRHVEDSQNDPLAWNHKDECYHLAQVAVNALMRLALALDKDLAHPVHSEEPLDLPLSSLTTDTTHVPTPCNRSTIHSDHYYDTGRNN